MAGAKGDRRGLQGVMDFLVALALAAIAAGAIALLGVDGPEELIGVGVVIILVILAAKLVAAHSPGKRIDGKDVKVELPAGGSLEGTVANVQGKGWSTKADVELADGSQLLAPIASLTFPKRTQRAASFLPKHFAHEPPKNWLDTLALTPQARKFIEQAGIKLGDGKPEAR